MSFSLFRVCNGWIVQTYGCSTGYNSNDAKDRRTTYVFTNTADLARFLNNAVANNDR